MRDAVMDGEHVERIAVRRKGLRNESPVEGIGQPDRQGPGYGKGFQARLVFELDRGTPRRLDDDIERAIIAIAGKSQQVAHRLPVRDQWGKANHAPTKT